MNLPLQITWHGIEPSPALEAAIRDKAGKLEQINDRIVSCRVLVELAARHKHHGNPFAVRVNLRLPGGEIAASGEDAEDVYVALRHAFDAARRQLADFAARAAY